MKLAAIAVLALFSVSAFAANMVARDAAGNSITLQDTKCVAAPWLEKWKAAVFIYGGKQYASCWRIQDNEVVILDSSGDVTFVPAAMFKPETGV